MVVVVVVVGTAKRRVALLARAWWAETVRCQSTSYA